MNDESQEKNLTCTKILNQTWIRNPIKEINFSVGEVKEILEIKKNLGVVLG